MMLSLPFHKKEEEPQQRNDTMGTTLKGFRYVLFVGAIVGGIGATLYPIVIKPMMGVDDYKELRKKVAGEVRKH